MAGKKYIEMVKEAEKAQKLLKTPMNSNTYEAFRNLKLKGINSNSILAKSVGVSTRTIGRYNEKFKAELSIQKVYRDIELNKMLEQVDCVQSAMRAMILGGELTGKDKFNSITSLMIPIKFKAEMMGFDRNSVMFSEYEDKKKLEFDAKISKNFAEKLDKLLEKGITLDDVMPTGAFKVM